MQVSSNSIKDILGHYTKRLETKYSSNESKFLVKQVVAFFTEKDFSQLALYFDERVSESLLLKIHFAIEELESMKPIQYVLGETEFMDLKLNVNEDVLIPRPETEEMVSLIIKENSNHPQKLSILDIGTGSGCIAISLSKNLNAKVLAVDKSQFALETAQQNASKNEVDIEFIELDILDKTQWSKIENQYDIIVSNPPYVCESEKEFMQSNVLDYEPEMALFVTDNNPLIFYKNIAEFASKNLKPNGCLWFEINENHGSEMKELLSIYFNNVLIINDFRERVRFAKAFSLKTKTHNLPLQFPY